MSGARNAGTVRISAGRWKGRRLEVPSGARPTSGRAREALFDILGARVPGARVLELYAGSGAVGIEAVSRGAAAAVLVERDAGVLRGNLERLGAGPEISVVESGAGEGMRLLASRGARFDIVFSDPPYALEGEPLTVVTHLLAPGALLILQRDRNASTSPIEGLARVGDRAYGRNAFEFFERR